MKKLFWKARWWDWVILMTFIGLCALAGNDLVEWLM